VAEEEFRMGGGLQYGESGQLNDQLATMEDAGLPATPLVEADVDLNMLPEEAVLPSGMDEYDEELLGPSRTDRPITHGAPYGLGANFAPARDETEQDYRRRVAEDLLKVGRAVPDDAKVWALRALAGE
jgi:hypothetical protein